MATKRLPRVQLRRRRRNMRVRAKRVYAIGQQQNAAAAQRQRQRGRARWLRFAGAVLIGAGAVIAVTHMLEHLDVLRLMSPGRQDLLIGYPTAGLLAIVGVVLVGQRQL